MSENQPFRMKFTFSSDFPALSELILGEWNFHYFTLREKGEE